MNFNIYRPFTCKPTAQPEVYKFLGQWITTLTFILHESQVEMYQKYKQQQAALSNRAEPGVQQENDEAASLWRVVDEQLKEYQGWQPPPASPPGIMGWRTVRVFVSSTFSDFFSEREMLVKKVFPELREWGSERKIRVIDCDLRWGIPHDTTSGETIAICMEELDVCHDTNEGEPFFINMLGERYGWIPSNEQYTREVREKYGWIDGASITLMEILHGAYRRRNPNAAFFIRDEKFLCDIPEEHKSKFMAESNLAKQNIQILRNRLRSDFPDQTYDYLCEVAGVSSSTGTEKIQLSHLDQFAEGCLQFLKSAIEKKYPQHQTVTELSEQEQEQELQRIFIREKAELVIGREQEVSALIQYLDAPKTCDLPKIDGENVHLRKPEKWSLTPEDNWICVVHAQSGWGKTSLLAELVLTGVKQGHNVFYHFCGSTSRSRQTSALINRLLQTLKVEPRRDNSSSEQKEDKKLFGLEKQCEEFRTALDLFSQSQQTVTVIVDAVNELDLSGSVDHLSWLPPSVPSNIRMIVSCNEHAPTLARLKEHPCYWLTVGALGESHMRSIATSYLSRYNKRLDQKQLSALTQDTKVDSPLWMTLICEELRVFGDFRTLTRKIESLPSTLDGLFGEIFARLLSEDGFGHILKVLGLIATSPYGMPTGDVLKLLGDVKAKEEAPPIAWARARRHLKPYLRIAGFPEEYVTFSHEKIWKAVEQHVLMSSEDRQKLRLHLADYYQYWSDNASLKCSILPEVLRSADEKKRFVEFMQKDKDSWQIGQFRRSELMRWCRCTRPTGPGWSACPIVICTFCSMKQGCFNPRNMRHSKESCVICGIFCFPQQHTTASLCGIHAKCPPNTSKCIVCTRVVHLERKMHGTFEGRLCQQCGFGNWGRMCAHVGER